MSVHERPLVGPTDCLTASTAGGCDGGVIMGCCCTFNGDNERLPIGASDQRACMLGTSQSQSSCQCAGLLLSYAAEPQGRNLEVVQNQARCKSTPCHFNGRHTALQQWPQ
jgi:hypothetical protein